MLTDTEIREAVAAGDFSLDPFDDASLQPASYDLRVGKWAFASSTKEKVHIAQKGVLLIEPGDFAVIETLETVGFGPSIAAQLGLRSEYARQGLLMLSGPQVDPGFKGVLVVRVMNLAPNRVALSYEAPFLTAQFFKLARPVSNPYEGSRQNQSGITPEDVQELAQREGPTLGEMVKTLGSLAANVAQLRGSVDKLTWAVPLIVTLGIAIIGILVGIK